jgi:hypothetical protein
MVSRHQEIAHSQARDAHGRFALGRTTPISYLEWLLSVIIIDPSVNYPTSCSQEEGGGHGQLIDF